MSDPSSTPAAAHGEHGPGGHVVEAKTLLLTWGTLLVLTVVTVAVSRINLGQMNVVAALAIACTKGAFVAAFFMHLKYEGRFNLVILLASIVFVIVLIFFVLLDSRTYEKDIRAYGADHPAAAAPEAPAEPAAE